MSIHTKKTDGVILTPFKKYFTLNSKLIAVETVPFNPLMTLILYCNHFSLKTKYGLIVVICFAQQKVSF